MTDSLLRLYGTSIGKKALMAVTGGIMALFVVAHLLGNLQVFGGPEKMNGYAALLHSMPALLWGARVVMLLAVTLHVVTGFSLIFLAWRSRPVPYVKRAYVEATISSRMMLVTGPLIALYLVYHLLHQTFGTILPAFDPEDVYGNLVAGFSSPPASAAYVAAMVVLGLHLKHGIWSMLQTLGLNNPRTDRALRVISVVVAVVVVFGFVSIPAAVLSRVVR